MMRNMEGRVEAVHASAAHAFSKETVGAIRLVEGWGVEGDAHFGRTVQHRSRVAIDPSQPNLRQVHLIHAELLDELAGHGHHVVPGQLGENITTRGVDLLALPVGTRLLIGEAAVTLTGLCNPCEQINAFQPGLLKLVMRKEPDGTVVRLAGAMGVVSGSGFVAAGDGIKIERPTGPHVALDRV